MVSQAPKGLRLAGRTVVMSGGSRGIGLAIALAAARAGANVVILAKTDQPHPSLPGTVHTAVEQIRAESAGGGALAVVGDVRDEKAVERAVDVAVDAFGGLDICINNAGAFALAGTEDLSVKRFELMQAVSVRGTFLLTRACVPHLRRSSHAHILTISPPLNMASHWLAPHLGYTVAKYGMTVLGRGFAAEFARDGIASNCLWPESTIATAAVVNLFGGEAAARRARAPQIMADAAISVLARPPGQITGQTLLDVEVLRSEGIVDFRGYGGGDRPDHDLFVDHRDSDVPQQRAPDAPRIRVADLARAAARRGAERTRTTDE